LTITFESCLDPEKFVQHEASELYRWPATLTIQCSVKYAV